MHNSIGFIGGGNMATAIIHGMRDSVFVTTPLHVIEARAEQRQKLESTYHVRTSESWNALCDSIDTWILAIKPQDIATFAASSPNVFQNKLLISIAAGTTSTRLAELFNTPFIVRAMPNLPALIGEGFTGFYCASPNAEHAKTAEAIFNCCGKSLQVTIEEQINSITALSGSGPGYVFYFLEAMQQTAIEFGFDAADAKNIALQTFRGAVLLAEQTQAGFSELRQQVTSKKGTTEAAITSMQQNKVGEFFEQGMMAALERARKLAE